MSLTPPPLRSGSVPAQGFSHGGHGGSEAAPPKPPSRKQGQCMRFWWAAALVSASLASSARADIYAFTDADGTVHFSSSPSGDARYHLYIRGNGRQRSGIAPGVLPVPPSDHDVARFTRDDDWILPSATPHQIPNHLFLPTTRSDNTYDPLPVTAPY